MVYHSWVHKKFVLAMLSYHISILGQSWGKTNPGITNFDYCNKNQYDFIKFLFHFIPSASWFSTFLSQFFILRKWVKIFYLGRITSWVCQARLKIRERIFTSIIHLFRQNSPKNGVISLKIYYLSRKPRK